VSVTPLNIEPAGKGEPPTPVTVADRFAASAGQGSRPRAIAITRLADRIARLLIGSAP
jgi:hypothetical protein